MDFNTAVKMPSNIRIEDFAGQISNEILAKVEAPLLYKITDREFPFMPQSEKQEIYNIALKNSHPCEDDLMGKMLYNRRKALIEESALDYLKENSYIILSGFVNFRLEEYKNELKKLCHNAAEEFSALREYDEFLNMLKFFVSVQSPKEKSVHIIKKGDSLRIFNKWHKDITDYYAEEFAFTTEEFTGDDIMLSALITIAPRKIIVHDKRENDKIYDTLASVFSEVEFLG